MNTIIAIFMRISLNYIFVICIRGKLIYNYYESFIETGLINLSNLTGHNT